VSAHKNAFYIRRDPYIIIQRVEACTVVKMVDAQKVYVCRTCGRQYSKEEYDSDRFCRDCKNLLIDQKSRHPTLFTGKVPTHAEMIADIIKDLPEPFTKEQIVEEIMRKYSGVREIDKESLGVDIAGCCVNYKSHKSLPNLPILLFSLGRALYKRYNPKEDIISTYSLPKEYEFDNKIDFPRIEELANAISKIPINAYYYIDTMEPEYQTFQNLYKKYATTTSDKFDSTLALLGIGTGLIDYQQKNPAKSVWQPLERVVQECGFPSELEQIRKVHSILAASFRFAAAKTKRVERMYQSGFASWFWNKVLAETRKDPYNVWLTLAGNMGDPTDKKTIVMAMKAFDMETLAVEKHYLPFPSEIPIMVDSRVAFVSLSSGIIAIDPSISIDLIASQYKTEIIHAWSEVIKIARNVVGKELNALRLDSLIWQAGEYRDRDAVVSYLRQMQLPPEIATHIGNQLIWKTL
jgi:N-glycosylase/DNA lyase/DNA-directed RNA polymerase subunit RPC12/RpoP